MNRNMRYIAEVTSDDDFIMELDDIKLWCCSNTGRVDSDWTYRINLTYSELWHGMYVSSATFWFLQKDDQIKFMLTWC